MPRAQADPELRRDGFRQLPRRQRRVFALALVHPFAQRRMGRLGVTVPTIQQRLPGLPTRFVLGAQVRHILRFDIQSQFGSHRNETFASFQALQKMFQTQLFHTRQAGGSRAISDNKKLEHSLPRFGPAVKFQLFSC